MVRVHWLPPVLAAIPYISIAHIAMIDAAMPPTSERVPAQRPGVDERLRDSPDMEATEVGFQRRFHCGSLAG